ncbi:Hypothetical predicted protein [Mytilus galloprovincialis]|uniref:TIR domain-containing protein n=3 Tax=Mytilus galloprovincialis TaxID=29158 RepID=A0A8B6FFJ2_MYTGA|nr:Hypothetical predicted protein [Mytilus galloprovincialis]
MDKMPNKQGRKKLCSPLDAVINNTSLIISREITNEKSATTLERSHTMSLLKDSYFNVNEAPSLPEDKEYHVFFSYEYANRDRNWVKAVVRELENKGFKCCVYEKDKNQSQSFSSNIQHFIDKSMRIVIVLSNTYINGDWAKMELEILSRGNVNDLVFIPVLIEPCNIPPFLKDCMFINATCKQVKWWDQFLELIRGACPQLPPKKKYHAFFAHTSRNKPWVADVVKMLESPKVGIVCCYPARNFKKGQSKRESIEHALRRSEKVVVVISDDFVNQEWRLYYENKVRSKDIIPVIVEDSYIPPALDECEAIDARSDEFHWLPNLFSAITDSVYVPSVTSLSRDDPDYASTSLSDISEKSQTISVV